MIIFFSNFISKCNLGTSFEKYAWLYIVGAVVKMSSQYKCLTEESNLYCFNGSKVVDGIDTPIGVHDFTSLAVTLNETNTWLQIDLGKSFCISAAKIWNRNMAPAGKYS